MAFRFRVAQPGNDISGPDKDQIFDTNFPVFNIVAEGTGTGNDNISHPMSLPTAFLMWTKNGWKPNSWIFHKDGEMSDTDGELTTNAPGGVDYKYIMTQRVLNGMHSLAKPDPGVALAVSDGTVGVLSATWSRLKFHSSKGTLQIWGRGSVDLNYNTDGTWYETSVDHGFSFTPAFMAFAYPTSVGALGLNNTLCNNDFFAVYGAAGRYTEQGSLEVCIDNDKIWFRVSSTLYDLEEPPAGGFIVEPASCHFDYIIVAAIDES